MDRVIKRTASAALTIMLCICMMFFAAIISADTVSAESGTFEYLDENGYQQSVTTESYVDDLSDASGISMYNSEGDEHISWYVLKGNKTFNNRLNAFGDVHLILCDGATLTANKGINVPVGSSLKIYAQSTGGGMGKLVATAGSGEAGIGGNEDKSNGPVFIYGGDIIAIGGKYAAGIGGGDEGHGGGVTITAGKVKATGGYQAAGIGGGDKCSAGKIEITGGTVTATGGERGAGIGGGRWGNAGTITITGGEITASTSYGGAGIGSGRANSGEYFAADGEYKGGTITISGNSRIHASAGRGIYEEKPGESAGLVLVDADDGGAGIGSGRSSYGTYVEISEDAYVTATNSPGAYSTSGARFSENSACIGTGYEPKTAGAVVIKMGNGDKGPKIDALMHFGTREKDSDYDAQAIGYGDDGDAGCDVTVDEDYEHYMVFTGNADSNIVSAPVKKDERENGLRQHYRETSSLYRTVRMAPCSHPDLTFVLSPDDETLHYNEDCQYCGGRWFTPHDYLWPDAESNYEYDVDEHWRKCGVCGYIEKTPHEPDESGHCVVCGADVLTLTFDANGGTGSMEPVAFLDSIKFTYPECGFEPPEGLTFIGWSTNGDTSTDSLHVSGTSDVFTESRTLTAIYSASWGSLQDQINGAASGSTITLKSHYYGNGDDTALTIPSGRKITIDLNGFDLNKRSGYYNPSEAVRVESGAELTLKDSSEGQKGKLTGGSSEGSGGGVIVKDDAKLFLESGSIYSNVAIEGGGVLVDGGEFTMSGGSITGNMAQKSGSAVFVKSGSFIMTGGSVSGNTGLMETAGAVNAESGSFIVSGSPVIGGNRCLATSEENDVYLDRPGLIEVSGDLGAGANISVTPSKAITGGETLVVTSGFNNGNYHGNLSNFVSSSDYLFGLNKSGEVIMGSDKVTVSFEAGEGASGSMDDMTALNNAGFMLPACSFTEPEGMVFEEWQNGSDSYPALSSAMISGDTTFTALWVDEADKTYRVSVSASEGGQAYAAKNRVRSGEVIGITAEPSDGYVFSKWTVSGTDATVDNASSASATLTVGSSDVTAAASFEPVKVSAVSLDSTELEMETGETAKLTASVVPYNAKNKSVTWSVVPEGGSVVSVNGDGTVTAAGPGSAAVRATTDDGGFTADCRVIVILKHTVTFDTDGGSSVASVKVSSGDRIDKPEDPAKDAYRFLGWKKVNGETVSDNYYDFSSPVMSDMTIKAVWEHIHDSSTLIKVPAEAVTCEADGSSEYWKCDLCSKYFADENGKDEIAENSWIIPALGHKWGSWTPDGDSEHKRTCAYDATHTEQAAHRWNDGEITTAPTYDAEGVMTYTCTDCGHTRTEAIGMLQGDEVAISVDRRGGGTVHASVPKGVYGDEIEISATAAEGYRFSRWEVSGAKATIEDVAAPATKLTIQATEDQHGIPVKVTAIFDVNISKSTATLSKTEFAYNGKTQKPEVISIGEGETERAFSDDAFDLQWSDAGSKEVGNYYVTIKGKGDGNNGLPVGELRAEYRIVRGIVDVPAGRKLTYNGKSQTGVAGGDRYTVKGGAGTNAGSYTAVVSLKDPENTTWSDGTTEDKEVSFSISKAGNPLSIKSRTATIKYKNLKKKTQTLAVTKVMKFTKKGQGSMTYSLYSAKKGSKSYKKYFKVNAANGKVTVKKTGKMSKGTYKVKVRVRAAGNSNYNASSVKTVTFTIKVK